MSDELMVMGEKFEVLAVTRPPEVVLEEARRAAKALTTVISGKKKPVVFNGETYLENEDWLTVARFYGVTSRIRSTAYIEYGDVHGFEATAEAYLVGSTGDGQVISTAEAMCLNDEPNWSKKPLFQLRSMAQTRASSRVLRQVFGWVVVLAGYKATPAEEMDGTAPAPRRSKAQPVGDVLCSECRQVNGHKPDCIHNKQCPECHGPSGKHATSCSRKGVIAEPAAPQEPEKPAEVPQSVELEPGQEKMLLRVLDVQPWTKGNLSKLNIRVEDNEMNEWELSYWHKSMTEQLMAAKGQICVFIVEKKEKSGREFYNLEQILAIGATEY